MHKAQRVVIRKKRASAMVQASQKEFLRKGVLKRRRKLRIIRATRFNSQITCVDAFLTNCALMRRLLPTATFQKAMQARSREKQKRTEVHLKTWSSDSTFERARRALAILAPADQLRRENGGRDFFMAYLNWRKARAAVERALGLEDFHDMTKKETGLVCFV